MRPVSVAVTRLVALLMLPAIASACSLTKLVDQANIDRLTIQRDALKSLKQDLADPSTLPDKQDLELLVGSGVLNETLAIADKLSMPIPNYAQGEVIVNQIRYGGQDGSGLLTVDASAVDHHRGLTLHAFVVARLSIKSDGTMLHGTVVVERLVPVLTGRCWSIGLIRFAQQLADAAATEWSMNNLKFDIPMSQAIVVNIPAQNRPNQAVPLPDGAVYGTLSTSAINYDDHVKLRALWLLRDGVHVLIAR